MPRAVKTPLTPEELRQIETMAGIGLKARHIAAVLGIDRATLYRRLRETTGSLATIQKGRGVALSQVAKTAYSLAVSGKVPAMTMFYLKTQGGWREKDRVSVDPIKVQVSAAKEEDVDRELERLRRINETPTKD